MVTSNCMVIKTILLLFCSTRRKQMIMWDGSFQVKVTHRSNEMRILVIMNHLRFLVGIYVKVESIKLQIYDYFICWRRWCEITGLIKGFIKVNLSLKVSDFVLSSTSAPLIYISDWPLSGIGKQCERICNSVLSLGLLS